MSKRSNLAIVFPGQGSQSLGMMDNLIKLDKDVKKIFNIASEILGYNILEIISSGLGFPFSFSGLIWSNNKSTPSSAASIKSAWAFKHKATSISNNIFIRVTYRSFSACSIAFSNY